ncbi:MAG TPA: Ig-like domain-containing protein, partial [Aggregatilineales bacterium]|nr:Ig-like domain-containing protein [Aggregatilineales bacterium]
PTVALTNGAACTVTLESTSITDDDVVDGANELDGSGNGDVTNGDADDYVLNFTVDTQPTITSAEAEVTNVFTALSLIPPTYADVDTDLRITFSEAMTVTGNWASLVCTTSGTQDVSAGLTVTDADPVFTLNPATNLTAGEDCTLTIFAAQVDDDDTFDPPANLPADGVYTFTVRDVPPQVQGATIPVNGATVANDTNITINFTENVNIAGGGITLV